MKSPLSALLPTLTNSLSPGCRSGLLVSVMALPLALLANLTVTLEGRLEFWRLFWISIACGYIAVANILTTGSVAPTSSLSNVFLSVAFSLSTSFISSAGVEFSVVCAIVLFLFQCTISRFASQCRSFSMGEALLSAQIVTAIYANFLLFVLSKIPIIESVVSPLRKLEPPLLKIAQFVLFAVWLIALITYPLLSTLRKVDRQSNTKKNDEEKEYERDDDDSKLYEMDMSPGNTESEFFARFTLVAVFLYIPLMFSLDDNPLFLVCSFLYERPRRILICVLWLLAIVVAVLLFPHLERKLNLPRIVARKLYHLLALVLFSPVVFLEVELLSFSFCGALGVFVLAELLRISRIPPFSAPLQQYFSAYIDDRDSGQFILSHIYLLLGVALPLWLHLRCIAHDSTFLLPALAGIISTCVCDTCASVFGVWKGRCRWPGTSKTVEGSLCGLAGALFFIKFIAICYSHSDASFEIVNVLPATVFMVLLEASTDQIDNLVLPLYYYAALALV